MKMTRTLMLSRLAAFSEDGAPHWALDRVRLSVGPSDDARRLTWRAIPSPGPTSTLALGLAYDAPVRRPYKLPSTLQWKVPTGACFAIELSDGTRPARDRFPRVSMIGHCNPLRYLASEGRTKKIHKKGNFIVPGTADPAHVRAECVRLVIDAADELRDTYREAARRAFGVSLDPGDIVVRLDLIEVAWDVHCSLATYAPIALRPAWECHFRKTDLHDGTWIDGGDHLGERFKLYRKVLPHVLRAEYVLEKARLRRLAKAERVLTNAPALTALVDRLSEPAFARFLHVQAEARNDAMPRLADLVALFVPAHLRDVGGDVFERLYATGRFENTGGSSRHRAYLRQLVDSGVVEHRGRGLYVATSRCAVGLRHLFALERARGRVA